MTYCILVSEGWTKLKHSFKTQRFWMQVVKQNKKSKRLCSIMSFLPKEKTTNRSYEGSCADIRLILDWERRQAVSRRRAGMD